MPVSSVAVSALKDSYPSLAERETLSLSLSDSRPPTSPLFCSRAAFVLIFILFLFYFFSDCVTGFFIIWQSFYEIGYIACEI
jgi:hypothetical protein